MSAEHPLSASTVLDAGDTLVNRQASCSPVPSLPPVGAVSQISKGESVTGWYVPRRKENGTRDGERGQGPGGRGGDSGDARAAGHKEPCGRGRGLERGTQEATEGSELKEVPALRPECHSGLGQEQEPGAAVRSGGGGERRAKPGPGFADMSNGGFVGRGRGGKHPSISLGFEACGTG